jgi:hypothetical protein
MSSRLLATKAGIARRKGMSPIRVLIEATLPTATVKQKSRWVRALQYLSSERVRPGEFRRFIRANGGIAGCARLAARVDRKRRRPRRRLGLIDLSVPHASRTRIRFGDTVATRLKNKKAALGAAFLKTS